MVEKGQAEFDGMAPKNAKAMEKKAEKYHATIRERMGVADREAEEKEDLRQEVAKSGLKPMEDGNILYSHAGVTIKVEPDKPGKITVTIDD